MAIKDLKVLIVIVIFHGQKSVEYFRIGLSSINIKKMWKNPFITDIFYILIFKVLIYINCAHTENTEIIKIHFDHYNALQWSI